MDISSIKKEIDIWFEEYFKNKGSYNKIIYDAMKYSVEVGGKRIRPALNILTYSMYKDDYKKILQVASAIEMIHTYSLIHDDLPAMDDDNLRRGKPTNHTVFGEAIAILAGDALLNEGMNLMWNYSYNNPSKNVIKSCNLISNASGAEGMIAGQVVDIISEGKAISEEELHYMHRKKTGALIKASILSGAILGEAKEKDLEYLSEFGEKLGLAFQIKDDILDVTGNSKVLGKEISSDDKNNKSNFISKYGLEECKIKCKRLTQECLDCLEKISKNTEDLKKLTLFLLHREF